MSDLTPLPAAERPVDVAEYQPISGLAVAAVVVSGLFAIILLVIVVTGFYTRKPALNADLLLLAIAAFVLAIAARVQIKRSEGTRTGQKLASVAWWISLVGGLAYGTYFYTSGIALKNQSTKFAEDWFKYLQRKDLETAFVLTIEPVRWPRSRQVVADEVEAEFPQQLQTFRQHDLIRIYQRNGEDVKQSFLGIRDWDYQLTGYHVVSTWRISSPEGEQDLTLSLNASEGKDVIGRQWYVGLSSGSGISDLKPTRYGRAVLELIGSAHKFALIWAATVGGNHSLAYARTLPEGANRTAIEQKVAAVGISAGGIAGSVALPEVPPADKFVPGFFQFTGKDAERDKAPANFLRIWKLGKVFPAGIRGPKGETPTARITESEVSLRVPIEVELLDGNGSKAYVNVTASNPEFIAKLWQARREGAANPGNQDRSRGDVLFDMPSPGWRIAGVESPLEALPTGPGGMPLPR